MSTSRNWIATLKVKGPVHFHRQKPFVLLGGRSLVKVAGGPVSVGDYLKFEDVSTAHPCGARDAQAMVTKILDITTDGLALVEFEWLLAMHFAKAMGILDEGGRL